MDGRIKLCNFQLYRNREILFDTMGNKMINCLCLYMRKAIPFGLQHVLAMFVANLAPVLIVCSAALVRGMVSSAGRCPDPYRVPGGKICVKGCL